MSPEILDLSNLTFKGVVNELGLIRHTEHPYFLNQEGNMVLFRGQSKEQQRLGLSFDNNAQYGSGAYLANVPSAVASQAYGSLDRGVAAYVLPYMTDQEVEVKRSRIGVEKSDASLVLFPMPFLTRSLRPIQFKGKRQDKDIKQCWAVIKEDNGLEVILNASKIAWLGQACIGIPRP